MNMDEGALQAAFELELQLMYARIAEDARRFLVGKPPLHTPSKPVHLSHEDPTLPPCKVK